MARKLLSARNDPIGLVPANATSGEKKPNCGKPMALSESPATVDRHALPKDSRLALSPCGSGFSIDGSSATVVALAFSFSPSCQTAFLLLGYSMYDAVRYRQEAEKCLRNAERATDSLERRNWWVIAEEWYRLAQIADLNNRQPNESRQQATSLAACSRKLRRRATLLAACSRKLRSQARNVARRRVISFIDPSSNPI